MPQGRADEEALTADIVALASQFGRYGYRRITALLREAGWAVNVKRVERIWRRDGGGTENSPGDCFPDDA
jgi:putative transposase